MKKKHLSIVIGGTKREARPIVPYADGAQGTPAGMTGLMAQLRNQLLPDEILAKRLPELLALSPSELLEVNVSVRGVVATVFRALPRLVVLRQRIAKEFNSFDLQQFDSLGEYGFALNYTEALVLGASRPPRCPPELLKEAIEWRRKLLADCETLANRQLVDRSRLQNLRGGRGYMDLVTDLTVLSLVLHESWTKIEGRCATTRDELNRVREVSEQLFQVAAKRQKQPEEVARASDLRARAWTLLARAYENARFAVIYLLRDQEAVDSVAPPLTSGRKRSKKSLEPKLSAEGNAESTASPSSPLPVAQPAATGQESEPSASGVDAPDAEPFLK